MNTINTKGYTDSEGRIVMDGVFLEPDCEVEIAINVSDNKFSIAIFPSEEKNCDNACNGECMFCPYRECLEDLK